MSSDLDFDSEVSAISRTFCYELSPVVIREGFKDCLKFNVPLKADPDFRCHNQDVASPVDFDLKFYFGAKKKGWLSLAFTSNKEIVYRHVNIRLMHRGEDRWTYDSKKPSNKDPKLIAVLKWEEISGFLNPSCKFKIHATFKYTTVNNNNKISPSLNCSETLFKDLLSMFESEDEADVIFNVCVEHDYACSCYPKVKAHKNILKARSLYFKLMFSNDMLENRTGQINITDCTRDTFVEMIKFIYTGRKPKINFVLAMELYPLTEKYQLQELQIICFDALKTFINKENLNDILVLAHKFSCTDLKQDCFQFMKAKLTEADRLKLLKVKELQDESFIDEMSDYMKQK